MKGNNEENKYSVRHLKAYHKKELELKNILSIFIFTMTIIINLGMSNIERKIEYAYKDQSVTIQVLSNATFWITVLVFLVFWGIGIFFNRSSYVLSVLEDVEKDLANEKCENNLDAVSRSKTYIVKVEEVKK